MAYVPLDRVVPNPWVPPAVPKRVGDPLPVVAPSVPGRPHQQRPPKVAVPRAPYPRYVPPPEPDPNKWDNTTTFFLWWGGYLGLMLLAALTGWVWVLLLWFVWIAVLLIVLTAVNGDAFRR